MRPLLLLAAVCLSIPAWAEAPTREKVLEEIRASGRYPEIASLFDSAPFSSYSPAQRDSFMAGLADELLQSRPSQHDRLLQLIGGLLRGGEHDPGGVRLREALSHLPPKAWLFVAEVEERRRDILSALGHGNNWDNFCENFVEVSVNGAIGITNTIVRSDIKKLPPNGTRCYDRASELREKTIDSEQFKPYRKSWSARDITANKNKFRGTHWAPCFTFKEGSTVVEIVSDPWEDMVVPAYTWWWLQDRPVHDKLKQMGRERWCDEADIEQARKAADEGENEEERAMHTSIPDHKLRTAADLGKLEAVQGRFERKGEADAAAAAPDAAGQVAKQDAAQRLINSAPRKLKVSAGPVPGPDPQR